MFDPDRSLLNPKFEGYKLDALDQDKAVSRFPVDYHASQTNASGRSPLSFQEVQSRIRHNHLTISPNGKAVYIDAEFRVISVDTDEATFAPTFNVLYELPRQIQTDSSDSLHREYPSSAFIDSNHLLVADGHGNLYVLYLSDEGQGQAHQLI
ncbi:hypothetical protein QCA50_006731 [Cerrena zonata]|uniref:Uncharacterized protein n=1 Tax=Cerrena zonata TaxID=2478898 RepID=A0AAW0GLX5_9APHY